MRSVRVLEIYFAAEAAIERQHYLRFMAWCLTASTGVKTAGGSLKSNEYVLRAVMALT